MPFFKHLPTWFFVATFTLAHAQEGGGKGSFLQAPELVPAPITEEAVEPEITIKESGRTTIYEYRVRGVLYMVKVQPQFGPSYYLYDINGDGMIDAQERAATNITIPQWILFQWE
ncbi:DUF2782 domain-containing protein [Caldichromatium japonicum]|uniref:DUF2782 domain-containing protein n=1 Tax=Caldichromatium japonicum TaxID=2699430 RepID=A0A6G7VDY2_9GAMM|nr:DUF2782 domain-containing protein [Caldichromatium japonicum]QIK38120.1 DUF2782 domain-containing protein [Caldichromatium japonicum]